MLFFKGFKPEKVPENIDTVIIGSGISGLTTAVLLGRAGHKVLVLEQHDQAGGCCHAFQDKGYEFATGKIGFITYYICSPLINTICLRTIVLRIFHWDPLFFSGYF